MLFSCQIDNLKKIVSLYEKEPEAHSLTVIYKSVSPFCLHQVLT